MTTGMNLVSNPLIKKVDITVSLRIHFSRKSVEITQAGTRTGREIGRVVGSNLGHYTAELGGKVIITNCKPKEAQNFTGTNHYLQ